MATPVDRLCSFGPTERGYVHLSPVQNTTQNIALGGSLQLQVQIEAYPPLHDWGWKHHNPSEDFENSQLENQMATGNNRYGVPSLLGVYPTLPEEPFPFQTGIPTADYFYGPPAGRAKGGETFGLVSTSHKKPE